MEFEGKFNGIKYTTYLAGPGGVCVTLYPEKHHTKDDIEKAKAEARGKRDVVRFLIEDGTHPRCTAAKLSELGECWAPTRFLGLCHERCDKVERCRHPEAATARIILAKRRKAAADAEAKHAGDKLRQRIREHDKLEQQFQEIRDGQRGQTETG